MWHTYILLIINQKRKIAIKKIKNSLQNISILTSSSVPTYLIGSNPLRITSSESDTSDSWSSSNTSASDYFDSSDTLVSDSGFLSSGSSNTLVSDNGIINLRSLTSLRRIRSSDSYDASVSSLNSSGSDMASVSSSSSNASDIASVSSSDSNVSEAISETVDVTYVSFFEGQMFCDPNRFGEYWALDSYTLLNCDTFNQWLDLVIDLHELSMGTPANILRQIKFEELNVLYSQDLIQYAITQTELRLMIELVPVIDLFLPDINHLILTMMMHYHT